MSKYNDERGQDHTLEMFLETHASAHPPNDRDIYDITPWRRNMRYVLLGLAFSTFTLSFLGLDYIFTTIGMLLLLLGFRGLRDENRWFFVAWLITLLRTLFFIPHMVLNSTLWQLPVELEPVRTMIGMGLELLLVFCFWRAIVAVKRKANGAQRTTSAAALFIFYSLLVFLAATAGAHLAFLVLPSLIVFFIILYNLSRLSKELDQVGYAMRPAAVHASDCVVATVYGLVLLTSISAGYLFFNQYPMDWTPSESAEHTGLDTITTPLIEKGFPADTLTDLTRKDIIACDNATQVVAKTHHIPLNPGRQVEVETNSYITVFDVHELQITQIALQFPDEPARWKIINHYRWTVEPDFYGTEAIQINPHGYADRTLEILQSVSGRVLYNEDGVTYTAPYHRLTNEMAVQGHPLLGEQMANVINAEFSLPKNGSQYRGYLTYDLIADPQKPAPTKVGTFATYVHQKDWFQYPVRSASQALDTGMSTYDQAFDKRHAWMSFSPDDPDGTLIPEGNLY